MKKPSEDSRPGILIILDGFGINPDPNQSANAIALAKTPTLNRLFSRYSNTSLNASEHFVGLPAGFMGNSEVGHLNIGAGRVVYQDFSLISRAIEENKFCGNAAFSALFKELKERPSATLHLIGLVSDGGVHSHIHHLFALIQCAKQEGLSRIAIHVITDGRDTSPTSGEKFIKQLSQFCEDTGAGEIATVEGRFYAMDRDKRWERTEKAFEAIAAGKSEQSFSDPLEYVASSYHADITDEFILPAVRRGYRGVKDGDGILFFNFRADRARQITRAFTDPDFKEFSRRAAPVLSGYVCMSRYDETFDLPVAFEKPKMSHTLGEIVSQKGWKQLRIAETEKYAHVTYFFNGGEEKVFPGEKRVLIPSPRDVKTYDLKPEMSAAAVTDALLKELESNLYHFVVVNFANPDMVGHTGNLSAAIKAVETVDACLARIVDWVETHGAFAILTADHGNCEQMLAPDGTPLTSHTTLPVPFIIIDPEMPKGTLQSNGRLCDIAPTMLQLWGLPQPREMTGHSLIEGKA